MSHDTWASFATQQLAVHFGANPSDCFAITPLPTALSVFAGGRGKFWPHEDGVVVIEHGKLKYNIAVEFKRQNEGLHGILTGLGQTLSYVNKGFSGAVLVIPRSYSTHSSPGNYITDVINNTVTGHAIGVVTYEEPDLLVSSPFAGKLLINRRIQVDTTPKIASVPLNSIETQWMHVREGSSTPDAFFRYLQTAKIYTTGTHRAHKPNIPGILSRAVRRIKPGVDPARYLSYTTAAGTGFHDDVWRRFWFGYMATEEVLQPWNIGHSGKYVVNDIATRIYQSDGENLIKFFSGRTDSIKNKLVDKLNAGLVSKDDALAAFAENVHSRAHSFREDIDSGLEAIGLLENDGKPTELGYRFVDACERVGSAYSATPIAILTSALLKNGGFGALLHYIYKLSEEKFRRNAFEFTSKGIFNSSDYMNWLEYELANNLRVIRKVSARGGTSRRPLQAELAVLGKFDLIAGTSERFRTGVGLVINWPKVQEAMDFLI